MKQIPSVNLSDFLSDDTNKRQNFIENIGKAYEDIGFVALKAIFWIKIWSMNYTKKFVSFLVFLTKSKLNMKFKGLLANAVIRLLERTCKGRTTGDLKEFFHFGQNELPANGEEYPKNVLVDEKPAFNAIGQKTL